MGELYQDNEICITIQSIKERYQQMTPDELLFHIATDGILYDEKKAEEGNCKCIKTPKGKSFCWDDGIIGALSQEQVGKFCKEKTFTTISPRMEKAIESFAEASKECKIGEKDVRNLEDRLKCMSKAALD